MTISIHSIPRTPLAAALLAVLSAAACAQVPKAPAPATKTGISAILSNQDQLLGALDRLRLGTLQQYAFDKFKIPTDQQAKYHLAADLEVLSKGIFAPGQRAEVLNRLAKNIEQVKALLGNDTNQLQIVAAALVKAEINADMATLEYWGEVSAVQTRLRPIAQASAALYAAAIERLTAQQKQLELLMDKTVTPAQRDAWSKLEEQLIQVRYTAACNDYAVVLSLERTDAKRAEVATKALAALADFDNPDQGVQNQVRIQMAKFLMARADKDQEDLSKAREKLDKVLADPAKDWTSKYEANYFKAIASILAKDVPNATKELEALRQWTKDNPPPAEKNLDLKMLEANASVLEYRWHNLKYQLSKDPKDNKDAIEELTGLLEKLPPGMQKFVIELIIEQSGAVTDYTKVPGALQLEAYQSRADDEVHPNRTPPADEAEKKARIEKVKAGLSSARETIRRGALAGTDVTKDAVHRATYRIGWYQEYLGDKGAAALAFIAYLDTYRDTPLPDPIAKDWPKAAFQAAGTILMVDLRNQWEQEAVKPLLLRFLEIGVNKPFALAELAMDYGRILVLDNHAELSAWRAGGMKNESQRQAIAKSAVKAAGLLERFEATNTAKSDPQRVVSARYYRLLALKQVVDASTQKQDAILKQVNDTAASLKTAIDQALTKGGIEAAVQDRLRLMKAQTTMLTAQLLWDADKDQKKPETAKQVLEILKDFEAQNKDFAAAEAMVNDVMSLRIQAMLTTGDNTGAADVVLQLLKKDPERAIRIVYTLLKMLEEDLDEARAQGNLPAARQILAARAKLTPFLVQQVRDNADPNINKYTYSYLRFDAYTKFQAGQLADDAAERTKWFEEAITRYLDLLKPENQALFRKQLPANFNGNPNDPDPNVLMGMAEVYFEMGKWDKCQPLINKLLEDKKLGQPFMYEKGADGSQQLQYNDAYWKAYSMKLKSSSEILRNPPPDFKDAELLRASVIKDLQNQYIAYKTPGGPKYFAEFEKLRQELLPAWKVPLREVTLPTTGATLPTTAP